MDREGFRMIDQSAVGRTESIRRNMAGFNRIASPDSGRRAAVVVCILGEGANRTVLLIKRASNGLNGGQWALPGGRVEPGESPQQAGLRELEEEVGLPLDQASVAGALDDFVTKSGYVITPIVAIVPSPPALRRNVAEVHSIHRIPLDRLLSEDIPRWRRDVDGNSILQLPLRRNMVVHAPTGAILYQFREVALRGRATRVTDLIQPDFTRT